MKVNSRDLLLPRQYIYNALHIIFGQTPTEAILAALLSDTSLETFKAPSEASDSTYRSAVEEFEAIKTYYLDSDDREQALRTVDLEYTRLFVGPNALPAPPWEMVYKTGRRELFQAGVLEIRAIYQSAGCKPAEAPHVSDDHLGIELDFMRFLCEKVSVSLEQDNEEETRRLEGIQRAFLKEHLTAWVPEFIKDLEAATKEPLYRAAGKVLGAFLELDAQLLQEQKPQENEDFAFAQ